MTRWLRLAALMPFTIFADLGSAATATAALSVTATVEATCTISAGSHLLHNGAAAQSRIASTVTIACTDKTPYFVNMSDDLRDGVTLRPKTIANGALVAQYQASSRPVASPDAGDAHNDYSEGIKNNSGARMPVFDIRLYAMQEVTAADFTGVIIALVTY